MKPCKFFRKTFYSFLFISLIFGQSLITLAADADEERFEEAQPENSLSPVVEEVIEPSISQIITPPPSTVRGDINLELIERPICIPIPKIAKGYEDIYRLLIGGKLIYKPNQDNDDGRIEIPFSTLAKPLKGTFDLSRFGDIGQYISISTGYRKEQKAENKDKTEVWIVPKFIVEKNLSSSAKHLAPIMHKFTSPIGIFWTCGGRDNSTEQMEWYDYLTTQNFADISNGENLYQKWCGAKSSAPAFILANPNLRRHCMQALILSFN